VELAWRAAGVGVGAKAFAALAGGIVAHRQVATDQENLFPVIMDERLDGEDAGAEVQKAGAVADLAFFVQRAGQDLLGDAVGIAGWRLPALVHIDGLEFNELFGVAHVSSWLTGTPGHPHLTPSLLALLCLGIIQSFLQFADQFIVSIFLYRKIEV